MDVQIVLVRHGETAWSKLGKHTGRTDLELTTTGKEQAVRVGQTLKEWNFTRRFSSPFKRALDTAKLSGVPGPVEQLQDLAEWDYGELEGKTNSEIVNEFPYFDKWSVKEVPGGESVEDVGKRAARVVDELEKAAQNGPIVVFAHGHLLSVLVATWLGMHPREGKRFVLETATASVLGVKRGDRVLRLMNQRCTNDVLIPESDATTVSNDLRF